MTTTSPTYREIATSFALWSEYADPSGLTSEREFDEDSIDDKIRFLVTCFGPEDNDNA